MSNDQFVKDVSIENRRHYNRQYRIEIREPGSYVEDAGELISINKRKKELYVYKMEAAHGHKYQGYGTCLHLMNIIEMLENKKINRIELFSRNSAIPFHIKNGFYPDETFETDDLKTILQIIVKDKTPELQEYSKQAAECLANESKPNRDALGNKIVYDYTREAFKYKTRKELENLFPRVIGMVLTKEAVLNNKDYYNGQFKKYGIDYQINDSSGVGKRIFSYLRKF